MKKIVLFLTVSFVVLGATAQIQRKPVIVAAIDSAGSSVLSTPKPQEKTGKRKMIKELNLSKSQLQQLKEMKKNNQVKKDEIENNSKLSAEEKKQQLRNIKKEQLQKLRQILTPEQLQKLKEQRKENIGENMMEAPTDN